MSASEKLKALETDAPTIGLPEPIVPELAPAIHVFATLINALPQIVAVVSEAERQVRESHEDDVDLELAAALAALEEALS